MGKGSQWVEIEGVCMGSVKPDYLEKVDSEIVSLFGECAIRYAQLDMALNKLSTLLYMKYVLHYFERGSYDSESLKIYDSLRRGFSGRNSSGDRFAKCTNKKQCCDFPSCLTHLCEHLCDAGFVDSEWLRSLIGNYKKAADKRNELLHSHVESIDGELIIVRGYFMEDSEGGFTKGYGNWLDEDWMRGFLSDVERDINVINEYCLRNTLFVQEGIKHDINLMMDLSFSAYDERLRFIQQ